MKINSILVRGIIKSFNISEKELQHFFKNDMAGFLDCREINHEYMMDASVFFNLIEMLKGKYNEPQRFYSQINKLNALHLGIFGNFLMSCKNMHNVNTMLEKYQMLVSDFSEFKYSCVKNEVFSGLQMPYRLIYEEYSIKDVMSVAEFELIFRHSILEGLMGKKVIPKRIMMNEELFIPNKVSALEDFFQCHVLPHKKYNEFIYSSEILMDNLPYNNYSSYVFLDSFIDFHQEKLYSNNNYHRLIKRMFMNNLNSLPLTIEEVSQRFNMSISKMQKILKSENTSYQKIYNETKQEVAKIYLNKNYKIKEVATILGYKEPNSFIRSFKSWYNITPDDYREKIRTKDINEDIFLAIESRNF